MTAPSSVSAATRLPGQQWHQAHAVEARQRRVPVHAEQVWRCPTEPMGLNGPVPQERMSVFTQDLPSIRREGSGGGHGEELHDAFAQVQGNVVRHTK